MSTTVAGGENLVYSPTPTGSFFTSSFSTFDVGGTLEGGDTLGGGDSLFGGAGSTDGGSGGGGGGTQSDQFDVLYGSFDYDWFF